MPFPSFSLFSINVQQKSTISLSKHFHVKEIGQNKNRFQRKLHFCNEQKKSLERMSFENLDKCEVIFYPWNKKMLLLKEL